LALAAAPRRMLHVTTTYCYAAKAAAADTVGG
jgi:hypothetical protein